jgi:hypothetical protein
VGDAAPEERPTRISEPSALPLCERRPVSLDFVYGDVDANGALVPLDGQQRLTTLFLLHWYLAACADRLEERQGWKGFRYATRASARTFCARLVEHAAPVDARPISGWIRNQDWYRFTWRHDPTIQSMLVMLDAINDHFSDADPLLAWNALVSKEAPAITFHLLATESLGPTEELYIKMNSRGRPLTPFENFKAAFEKFISWSPRAHEFAEKVDREWSDLLWSVAKPSIDDAYLRYFQFIARICEWRESLPEQELDRREALLPDARARELFDEKKNAGAAAHLAFVFDAFDVWCEKGLNVPAWFAGRFAAGPPPLESGETSRAVLYDDDVDLLAACCRSFGAERGSQFTVGQVLLLYGAIIHRRRATADFPRRLRTLRNLIFASTNELRPERMTALLRAVERLVEEGELEAAGDNAFNVDQVLEERRKRQLLSRSPALARTIYQLEDHPSLRGSLGVFDLEATNLEARAEVFHASMSAHRAALGDALLATGEFYRRPIRDRRRPFQFPAPPPKNEGSWRDLLAGDAGLLLAGRRELLGRVLDEIAAAPQSVGERLAEIRMRSLRAYEEGGRFDWRYYFVKYPAMREGRSGLFVSAGGALGFDLCMLDGENFKSKHRDPYLWTVYVQAQEQKRVLEPRFPGYETQPRWLRLEQSKAGLRCVAAGFQLEAPLDPVQAATFDRVCAHFQLEDRTLLPVGQGTLDGGTYDTQDRIQLGARFVRALVDAGL